jgi:Domain of unknown function (DUF4160)
MPAVSRFRGVVVTINFDDHPLPHFHARYGAAKASIRIDPPSLIDGWLPPRQLRDVTDWAATHLDALLAAWALAEDSQDPGLIPPLA